MKIHRFLGLFFLTDPEEDIEDAGTIHQITRVLRLHEGSRIILGNMKGKEALCEISEVGEFNIRVKILEVKTITRELPREVSLFCSVLKGSNMDLVVQKATETGVSFIIPITTAYTVKPSIRKDRLEKIAKEATEQSGRGTVPQILSPIPFAEAITLFQGDLMLFFDPSGERIPQDKVSVAKHVGVFVGPEGGWTQEEISLAKERLAIVCSLGPLVLRAETAAIIAPYLALSLPPMVS
ncbi:MAG: 16S rRNA (uracil(1498)-N(3))-methyltransferase [bacterium]|nr:16S rRNA (uracil(1498)-N(3))-methyltransferase [bacterium]